MANLITGSPASVATSGAANSLGVSPGVDIPAGSTVVVVIAQHTPETVSKVSDGTANVYSLVKGITNLGSAALYCCLKTVADIPASAKIIVLLGGFTRFVVSVAGYAGVVRIGNTNSSKMLEQQGNPNIALAIQDPDNIGVAGFAGNGAGTYSDVAGGGTVETQGLTSGGGPGVTNCSGAVVDIPSPAGEIVIECANPDTSWAIVAAELRSV